MCVFVCVSEIMHSSCFFLSELDLVLMMLNSHRVE